MSPAGRWREEPRARRLRCCARTTGIALLALLLAGGCAPARQPETVGLANPASTHCIGLGGELRLQTLGDGATYGVCVFEDNRQCEEWALYRGDCPVGGRKITGYVTAGARYCAIVGGRYTMDAPETETAPERGTCALPDGRRCSAATLYAGRCED